MQSVQERKAELREQFRKTRLQIDPEARSAKSLAVCDALFELLVGWGVSNVHAYWPLLDKGELDTRPLITQLHDRGVDVILPRTLPPSETDRPTLTHHLYKGEENLRRNAWGIAEPVASDQIEASAIEAVVVPAFGAGRNRHRIGHGFGYYDRFLAEADAHTACAIFHECLMDQVPAESHDVPLDIVVTDKEKIEPST